ncbi:general transcriptional corepressor [Vairimorpha necatrix]|uniref:General transcriptional corepressor n=1 Tax=Vairimorpha necatrix TaxID=6039 RepID=A0AAX4JD89_9MICR
MEMAFENLEKNKKVRSHKNKIYLNIRESTKCCNEALLVNPKNINSLYVLGKCFLQQDNLELTREIVEKIRSVDPKQICATILEGHILLKTGQIVEAYDKFFLSYLNTSSYDVFLFYGLGLIYDLLENFELSREWFTLILSADVELPKVLEIMYRIGICYKKERKFTDALGVFKVLESFVKFDSLNDDVNLQIAHIYEITENTEMCSMILKKLMVSSKQNILAARLFNWLNFKEKNYDAIKNIYKCHNEPVAIKLSFKSILKELEYCNCDLKNEVFDPYILYIIGRVMAEEGKYDDALEIFLLCSRLDPAFYISYNSAGVMNFKLKRYEPAQKLFQQALVKKPYCKEALNNLKIVDYKLRKVTSSLVVMDSDANLNATRYIDSQVIFNEPIYYVNVSGMSHIKDLDYKKFLNN